MSSASTTSVLVSTSVVSHVPVLRLRALTDEQQPPPSNSNQQTAAAGGGGGNTIALSIPLIEDPRLMRKPRLIIELKRRGINAQGRLPVLIARLIRSIVDEGKDTEINALLMDDRQPEKWVHLANVAFEEACQIECDPENRVMCMERVNKWIEENLQSHDLLAQAGKGDIYLDTESTLFNALLRFATSLMIQPGIEENAVKDHDVSSEVVRGSVFIFQMYSGRAAIPPHLLESTASYEDNVESAKREQQRQKRVHINCDRDENHSEVYVELGKEVSVDVGCGRSIRARVSRVEACEDTSAGSSNGMKATVFARPVNSQFAGSQFEFQLNREEYEQAVEQVTTDTLGQFADADLNDD